MARSLEKTLELWYYNTDMKAKLTTIGSKVLVDFPTLTFLGVPAKVDTGADSSSIWASNIKEKDGILSFCLFGPTSPFFTGETIEVAKFSLISVKNSFGATEYRYKVNLPIKLAGRTINANFTLADRSKNSQPILIGRRTLKGKFLVDVGRKDFAQQ